MRNIFCLVLFILISSTSISAQSKKQDAEGRKDNSYAPFSAAESAMTRQEVKASKKARKNKHSFARTYKKSLNQKVEDFHKRIKKNARDDRKEARIMKKPQYSDPSYFGHKQKPKKRPLGKRKFCKECGIVH